MVAGRLRVLFEMASSSLPAHAHTTANAHRAPLGDGGQFRTHDSIIRFTPQCPPTPTGHLSAVFEFYVRNLAASDSTRERSEDRAPACGDRRRRRLGHSEADSTRVRRRRISNLLLFVFDVFPPSSVYYRFRLVTR